MSRCCYRAREHVDPIRHGGDSHPEMSFSPGSVELARVHPLTKTHAMEPSRQTWSSYGPPYPLGRWSSDAYFIRPGGTQQQQYHHPFASEATPFRQHGEALASPVTARQTGMILEGRLFLSSVEDSVLWVARRKKNGAH